jgi:uncharacterized protein YndB with AHSA1/START domain
MKHEPFVIERTFNAPVEKVWKAITDKSQMKEWYFDLAEFRAEPGFEFSFTGTDHDGKEWLHLCRVVEVIENRKLSHTWRYKDQPGDSTVTWELFDENGRTRVRLTHAGLETFPPIKSMAKENFVQGWTEIVGTSLKNYLEKNA